jgi:serine phosphatase RsbU (regulator of sigma subunit)
LLSTGPLLGIIPNAEYGIAGPFKLYENDVLVFMTDGLFECMNDKDETFGKDRVQEVIAAHASKSAKEILDALFAAAAAWIGSAPERDDVTLVVVKISGEFGPSGRKRGASRRIRPSQRIEVRLASESGRRIVENPPQP